MCVGSFPFSRMLRSPIRRELIFLNESRTQCRQNRASLFASQSNQLRTYSVGTESSTQEDIFIEKRDLESYRRAFDRVSIPDSLERIVNQHMTTRLTGAEAVYRMLSVRGVRHVFGYSGGAVLPLVDQFHSERHAHIPGPSIKFINTAHEQTAAHAAQAFGRVTGRPGIVVVTSGPGLTNCITGLQDALMDGDPMLVLSGQVCGNLEIVDIQTGTNICNWDWSIPRVSSDSINETLYEMELFGG